MEIENVLRSFIIAYAGEIITVILGLTAIYIIGKNFTDKFVMKVFVSLCLLLVLGVCFRDFCQKKSSDLAAPTTEFTETIGEGALVKLAETDYESVIASSMHTEDIKHHYPRYLIDDDPSTNWAEGVIGYGEGQYVDFVFKAEQAVAGFAIRAGNQINNNYYLKNARPHNVKITCSDNTNMEFTLEDKNEEQVIMFDKPVSTSSLRLTIQSVYEGTTHSDTVISDFSAVIFK